jgi:hypothetical protein
MTPVPASSIVTETDTEGSGEVRKTPAAPTTNTLKFRIGPQDRHSRPFDPQIATAGRGR